MMIRSLEKHVEFEVAVFPAPDFDRELVEPDQNLDRPDAAQIQFLTLDDASMVDTSWGLRDSFKVPAGSRLNLVRYTPGGWALCTMLVDGIASPGVLVVDVVDASVEEGEEAKA